MKLSVCMIVRNEGQRLTRALESVREVADEIIVTDTGSTDDTVAIAQRFGAKVNSFEWCEDFAAARNACQAHARGEWLLWLDGDERLKPGTERFVLDEIKSTNTVAYQLVREENYFTDREGWTSGMYILRLLRRDLPCTYVGRIHEHYVPWPVDLAIAMRKSVRVSRTRLEHWGFTPDRIGDKYARAARMCEMELRERPGQLYYLVELMRAQASLPDRESQRRSLDTLAEATAILLAHRHDKIAPSPLAASLIEHLLAMRDQQLVSVDELLSMAGRWFATNAPLVWATARTHFVRGDWVTAQKLLNRLLDMLATHSHDHLAPFDPRIGEDAKFNLGVCAVRLAELDQAQCIFTDLLTSARRGAEARANLDVVLALRAQFGA